MSTSELLRPDLVGAERAAWAAPRRGSAAHDDRARAPRRRVQQGRGHLRPLRRRGARGRGRHLYRRRARQHPQPRDGPAGRARRHAGHPPRRDGPRRRDPRRVSTAGSATSTPGSRRATRCPPLPEGCFALGDLDEQVGALVAVIRELRPHVAGHLRRARRLPAPGPHPLPRDLGRRVRRRGRPRPVPGGGRAVAAAEALLLPRVLPGPHGGLPRRAAGARARVAVRGVAGELVVGHPGPRRAGDHAGAVRRLVPGPRRGPAGPRHADRPREPLVPRAGATCSARSGRRRTTSSSARWSSRRCPKTTCSPGSRCRARERRAS